MAFRRDSKVDAFQRQISALRHQLGGEQEPFAVAAYDRTPAPRIEASYRNDFPDFDSIGREPLLPSHERSELSGLAEPEPASLLPAVPSVDTQTSVIAHSTVWNGNLESTGSLHVHGRVEGSLTARDHIFVAEEAEVDAILSAANVTIAGNVRGSIQCADRFEVLPHGRVAGDVRAPVVVIHEGALVVGEIAMSASKDAKATPPPVAAARAVRGGD